NNYVKELNIILPNGTNIGETLGTLLSYLSPVGRYWLHRFLLLPIWGGREGQIVGGAKNGRGKYVMG
ncbi:MAG TPA: hypothetical protein PLP03_07890, partial [Bacteroidales bacterium]|nr:hypothetical protein [Bacteroidales bacterium]